MKVSPYIFVGLEPNYKSRVILNFVKTVNPLDVLEVVAKETSVTVEDIISKTRVQNIAEARQLFCHVIRERYGIPFAKIGKLINRDHATILHSIKAHKNRHDVDKQYRELTRNVFVRVENMVYDYSS